MNACTRALGALGTILIAIGTDATVLAHETDARRLHTVTGRMSSDGCGLAVEHAAVARGEDGRAETARCLAAGKPAVIRDDASGEVYFATFASATPAERTRWLAQPGKRVRVSGVLREEDDMRLLAVERLRIEHDHDAAPHGGVVGMVGEHHLELVVRSKRDLRLYLLDAFLDPISTVGTVGTAVIADGAGATRSAELRVADGGAFVHIDGPQRAGDRDVTVTFTAGPIPPTSMNLPFPNAAARPDTCPHHPQH